MPAGPQKTVKPLVSTKPPALLAVAVPQDRTVQNALAERLPPHTAAETATKAAAEHEIAPVVSTVAELGVVAGPAVAVTEAVAARAAVVGAAWLAGVAPGFAAAAAAYGLRPASAAAGDNRSLSAASAIAVPRPQAGSREEVLRCAPSWARQTAASKALQRSLQ